MRPGRASWALLATLLLVIAPGCETRATTKEDHFERTQMNTQTPDGRPVPGSAESTGPDTLKYRTDKGRTIKVRVTRDAEGRYRYSDAQRLK